jgi:HSP20 family molecular chaperone IbpA
MTEVIIRVKPLKANSYTFHQLRGGRSFWQVVAGSHSWCPPTDVYETENQISVKVEAAGMKKGEFTITVDKQLLLIEGSRPSLSENCAYHQMEIGFGEFRIGIELSSPVIADQIKADYEDGFLNLTLPKQKPDRINIKE